MHRTAEKQHQKQRKEEEGVSIKKKKKKSKRQEQHHSERIKQRRKERRHSKWMTIVASVAVLSVAILWIIFSWYSVILTNNNNNQRQPYLPTVLTNRVKNNYRQKKDKLPYPVFVVGYPKVGTSSIHAMFQCSGISSSHYCCCGSNNSHTDCRNKKGDDKGGGRSFAECMRANLKRQRPILENCGNYSVYAQMDSEMGKSMFLPQHFHLHELHEFAPNATFILNLRPAVDWVTSVSNWYGLGGRFLRRFNVDPKHPNRDGQLVEIYNNHTTLIRQFCNDYPSHRLLEVDVSSAQASSILSTAFDLDESCWGNHNQNKRKKKLLASR